MKQGKWTVGFSDQGLGHGTYGVMVKDTSEVVIKDLTKNKAKEFVRRWNAFEDGGIVELCRDLKARLSVYERRHRDQCILGDECPDKRLLKKAEAALAKI